MQVMLKKKKYEVMSDIMKSDEFKVFRNKIYKGECNPIIAKIAKKKGLKLESKFKTDLNRNIMMDVNEFYNSEFNII